MKKTLFCLMLISTSAFADWTPVSETEAQLIREALGVSIKSSGMACTVTTAGTTQKLELSTMASYIATHMQNVYVNSDETAQPSLAVTLASTNNKEEALITTSPDGTKVVSIAYTENTVTIERVNTGTIRNPKFEDKEVLTLKSTAECK